jgi:hypothetical protein
VALVLSHELGGEGFLFYSDGNGVDAVYRQGGAQLLTSCRRAGRGREGSPSRRAEPRRVRREEGRGLCEPVNPGRASSAGPRRTLH